MSRGLPVLPEFKVAKKQGKNENEVHPKQYRRPTLTQHEVHSHAAGFMPEILTFRSRVRERSPGLKLIGTHFEPQPASVDFSQPDASAYPSGCELLCSLCSFVAKSEPTFFEPRNTRMTRKKLWLVYSCHSIHSWLEMVHGNAVCDCKFLRESRHLGTRLDRIFSRDHLLRPSGTGTTTSAFLRR